MSDGKAITDGAGLVGGGDDDEVRGLVGFVVAGSGIRGSFIHHGFGIVARITPQLKSHDTRYHSTRRLISVSRPSGRILGTEATVRWPNPGAGDRGLSRENSSYPIDTSVSLGLDCKTKWVQIRR